MATRPMTGGSLADHRVRVGARRLLLLWVALTFFLLFYLYLASVPGGDETEALILFLAFVLGFLAVEPVLWRITNNQFDPFEPLVMFNVFFFLGYVLQAPILLFWQDLFSADYVLNVAKVQSTDNRLMLKALVYAGIGLLCFLGGHGSGIGDWLVRRVGSLPASYRASRLTATVVLYAVIGVGLFGVLVYQEGGLGSLWSVLYSRFRVFEGKYYFVFGAFIFLSGLLLSLGVRHRGRAALFHFPMALISLLLFVSTGSRAYVLSMILSLIVVRHYLVSRLSLKKVVAIGLILALIYVAYGTYFREYIIIGYLHADPYTGEIGTTFGERILKSLAAGSAIQLQQMMIVLTYYQGPRDWLYGSSFLNALAAPVPRAFWKEKPVATSLIFTMKISPNYWLYGGGTLPPSLLGEFVMQLGLLGLVAGALALGIIWRFWYSLLRLNSQNPGAVVLYAVTIPFLFHWMRGDSFTPTIAWLMLFLPIAFGLWVAGERSVARASAAPAQE